MPKVQIRADTLPQGSCLWDLYRPGDFLDCYSTPCALPPRAAALLGLAMPAWARGLLGLRNALMRPFGLRTEAPATGESIGLFPVCKDGPDECVLGFDDRHLNFRITILRAGNRAYLSTWVHPHNIWGRTYLALVMPFHVLIVKGAARRMGTAPGAAPPAPSTIAPGPGRP